MEYDEAPNNVHALFPGIDTTPFGRAASLDELSDQGWSAVPERTIAAEEAVAGGRGRAGHSRRAVTAMWVGVAVLAGAGLAGGREVLAPSARSSSHLGASSVASHRSSLATSHALLAFTLGRRVARVVHRDVQRAPAHPTARRRASRPTRTTHKLAASASAPAPVPPAPEQTASAPVYASAGSDSGGGGGESSAGGSSSSSSAQRAGPSGPVSLIGAGTTPSG